MQKLFELISKKELKKIALTDKFYNKRKRDTKLEWCEDFLNATFNRWIVEPSDLLAWLESNPPLSIKQKQKADASALEMGEIEGESLPELDSKGFDGLLVTAAQNNTEVNQDALNALKRHADENNLKLVVMPIYYNKNAFSAAVESEAERFSPAVTPYLLENDVQALNGRLVIRSSAAVLPTAKFPINKAMELNTGEPSTLVASTKQQHKTLPRSPATGIREAWTTGSVTTKNYIRGGAGASAKREHVYGGIEYYLDADGLLMSRNLQYKNGYFLTFTDSASPVEVMTLGDLHSERKDPNTWVKTLALVKSASPSLLVVHDILHFETASHHNRNDGKHLYSSRDKQVIDDLRQVIDDLNELAWLAPVYVVESNHNSALDNWLHDTNYNPKRDPRQAKLYYLLNWLVCDAIDNGQDQATALQVAFDNLDRFEEFPTLSDRVRFGSMDKAEVHCGVDFSQHGHKGQNGSAGNTNMFSKWLQPMVTGHTHSPAIIGDTVTVGVTASLNQGYNRGGASSWRQSHAVTFANGFTQLIHVWAI